MRTTVAMVLVGTMTSESLSQSFVLKSSFNGLNLDMRPFNNSAYLFSKISWKVLSEKVESSKWHALHLQEKLCIDAKYEIGKLKKIAVFLRGTLGLRLIADSQKPHLDISVPITNIQKTNKCIYNIIISRYLLTKII